MSEDQIKQAAAALRQQETFEYNYRCMLAAQIKELEKEIRNSFDKNLYKLVYKAEYGDYTAFIQSVAEELRNTKDLQP